MRRASFSCGARAPIDDLRRATRGITLVRSVAVVFGFVGLAALATQWRLSGGTDCSSLKASSDLGAIVRALRVYAKHHDGRYPTSLDALVEHSDDVGPWTLHVQRLPRDP